MAYYPDDPLRDRSLARKLSATADHHPMMVSYLRPQAGVAPRRLSDVCSRRELIATRTYSELLRPTGVRHQLTVLTSRITATTGRGWAINRSGSDFTDRDLELAGHLQPLLSVLDQTAGQDSLRGDSRIPELAAQAYLTSREREVLWYMSKGLTAAAIG